MNELDLFTEALSRTDPAERAAYLDQACAGNPELRRRLEELLTGHARGGSPLDRPPLSPGGIGATVDLPNATGEHRPEAAPETLAHADPDATSALESGSAAPTIAPTQHGLDGSPGTTARPDPDVTTASGQAVPTPRAARVSTGEGIGTVIAERYTLVEVIGEGGMGSVYLAEQTEPVKRQVAIKLIRTGMDSRGVLARFDAERQALALMDHPNIAHIYDGGVTPSGQPYFVMELVKGVPLTDYCDAHRLTVKARLELFVAICQAVQHAHQKGIIHRDLKPSNVMVTEVDGRPTPKVIDFGVAKATEQNLTDISLPVTGAIVGTPAYMSPEQADPSSMDIDTRTDVYALGVILYELLVGSPPLEAKDFKRGAVLEMLRMVREVDPPRPSTKLSTAEALPNIAANRSIEPARLAKLFQGELDWVVMKALDKDRTRRYETVNGFARDIQHYLADEVVEARPPSRGYRLKKFVKRNKIQVIAASLVFFALLAGVIGTSLGLREANRATIAERAAKGTAERNLAFAKKGNEILGSVFAGLDPKKIAESGRPLQDVLRENLVTAVKQLEGSAIGDPLEVAAMQHTLGESLFGLGEYDLAVEVLEKVRATLKSKLRPDHPDTLTVMNNLAVGYQYAGKLDKALPLLEETLALRKSKLGPDHPDTLDSMNSLAGGYLAAEKPDKALPLLEETLALRKTKLGPDHPETLESMHNLAGGYRATGKLDKALPLFEETLALTKPTFGPDHPETLVRMSSLAAVYWSMKRLDKSVPLFEDVLKRQEAKLSRQHPDTQLTVANLGVNYKDAGRLKEAIPLLEEAHQAAKRFPTLSWVDGQLIDAYAKAGENAKLAKLIQEYFADARKRLPKDSPQLAGLLVQIGMILLQQKKWTEAERLLRECLAIREQNEPDDWRTFNTKSMLGGVLLGQKKFGETEPLLLAGYEGLKQREKTIPPHPQFSTVIPEALDRLIDLFTATNKSDDVKRWQAERAKYPATSPRPGENK